MATLITSYNRNTALKYFTKNSKNLKIITVAAFYDVINDIICQKVAKSCKVFKELGIVGCFDEHPELV